tara:strand:- start:5395 stop:6558 length:1164 start_codon:yes stop_codon:yes gene_type:complete
MSDIDVTNGKTMVILVPLDKSDEVKTVLIDKKIYQNMFRPKRISNSLALPIKNNYQNLHQELTVLFPEFSSDLEIIEKTLEINKLGLSPADLVKEKIKSWLQENNFQSNGLLDKIPKKWELLGDLVLLPSTSFIDDEWQALFSKCDKEQMENLWKLICQSLKVEKLGRQQPISNDMIRTSQVELLLGNEGWVELIDHGVHFGFDATKVMYSSGNVTERHRIGNINMEGEVIVDAFAGIGYYSLPILVRSKAKHVHACEINPNSIKALTWGAKKNCVEDRITIHEGDNKLSLPKLEGIADRCHLGLLPSSESIWFEALKCLKKDGGWLHIHMNVPEEKIKLWSKETISKLEKMSKQINKNWKFTISNLQKVKWYAPYIRHVVLDVEIK